MNQSQLSYGSKTITKAYDTYLVPVIFDPWAEMLLDHLPPSQGATVLDLSTGTGIVAYKLAERIGQHGKVIAVDPSHEMLHRAKERCQDASCHVTFIQSSAESIDAEKGVVDFLYCQQGLQFFEDYAAAAKEIERVLKPGGKLVLSTWLPISRCHYFSEIYDALKEVNLTSTADRMADSFDPMQEDELMQLFMQAGLVNVEVTRQSRSMRIEGGTEKAIDIIFGTLAGPALQELSKSEYDCFRESMIKKFESLRGCDGVTYGSLASTVLTAAKPLLMQ